MPADSKSYSIKKGNYGCHKPDPQPGGINLTTLDSKCYAAFKKCQKDLKCVWNLKYKETKEYEEYPDPQPIYYDSDAIAWQENKEAWLKTHPAMADEDSPILFPLPPEIEVHGFKDLHDTIVFRFSKGLGDMVLKTSDPDFFDASWLEFAMAGELSFANVPIDHYRLYKTTVKPKGFQDFTDFKEILTKDGFFLDSSLQSNQVYYYAARSALGTSKVSPFTPIYKVEIIEEAGTFFPLIEVIQLDEEPKRKKQITFRKKLRIQPSFLQSAPNKIKNDLGFTGDSPDESVFGDSNKFKIRLTSRKTKRKIDLNVRFVKSTIPSGEGDVILAWETPESSSPIPPSSELKCPDGHEIYEVLQTKEKKCYKPCKTNNHCGNNEKCTANSSIKPMAKVCMKIK